MRKSTERDASRAARADQISVRVNWWLRITSSGWDKPQKTPGQREKARRSALLAWILLGVFVALSIFIPTGFTYPPAMVSVIATACIMVFVAGFNRLGLVTTAGLILVISACLGTFGVVIASPDGAFHVYFLPAFDFLAIPVILGASILPRISAFFIAALNIIAIYLDLLLQPKAADMTSAINTYSLAAVTARPVALLVITAVIAYLWVRSMDRAIERADRAEELRALEQYLNQMETEYANRVKEFVQEIINAISMQANGQEGLLLLPPSHPWQQQAIFINTQLKQFHKLKHTNSGKSDQLLFASEMLLRVLQRIHTGQAEESELDPQRFTTRIPVTDEIAKYIYMLLQSSRPLHKRISRTPYGSPGQFTQD